MAWLTVPARPSSRLLLTSRRGRELSSGHGDEVTRRQHRARMWAIRPGIASRAASAIRAPTTEARPVRARALSRKAERPKEPLTG